MSGARPSTTSTPSKGAVALARHLRNWEGGRLVVNVVENPIKCPVAPLEFLMLADWFFHEQGIRDKVELIYATPLSGAFTKPIAAKHLGDILDQKGIKVVPDFMVEHVDPDAKKLVLVRRAGSGIRPAGDRAARTWARMWLPGRAWATN